MSAALSHPPAPPRRVVLVDFDWHDADLLVTLARRPDWSVRLVAGEKLDDPGVRIAELCGIPRTVDLGDLTREIFDLALVSERSRRRTQVEGLLHILGTPCVTPEMFLDGPAGDEPGPSPVADTQHARAFESSLEGPVDGEVERALQDLSIVATPPTASPRPAPATAPPSLEGFPTPEDRQGLEAALAQAMSNTGATAAELRTGDGGRTETVVRVGSEDRFLEGLVELALRLGEAQVVTRLAGPMRGRAWGAWPFRTTSHQGVVAAGGIDPAEGWTAWEHMVEELRTRWDERDREQAAPAFPMTPRPMTGWLDPREFRSHLELAVERHRRDGLRFAVYRLTFGDDGPVFSAAGARIPDLLRDTDSICRVGVASMLLLTPCAPRAYVAVRDRIAGVVTAAWNEAGRAGDPPPVAEDHVELLNPDQAPAFLDGAQRWLTGDPPPTP